MDQDNFQNLTRCRKRKGVLWSPLGLIVALFCHLDRTKSHYKDRASFHEAQTKNRKAVIKIRVYFRIAIAQIKNRRKLFHNVDNVFHQGKSSGYTFIELQFCSAKIY